MKSRLVALLLCAIISAQACDSSVTNPSDNPHGPSTPPSIVSVAAGIHPCAISNAGSVYCWGATSTDDSPRTTPTPVLVTGDLAFKSLSVSKVEDVVCGLTNTGAAFCWGENDAGQLGDGTTTRRTTPTGVAGGIAFKSIAVGNTHVCGVAVSGTAYCWGTGSTGALGDGTNGMHLTPAPVASGLSFQSVVAGSGYTCGLATDGTAYCWGLGISGQLGNNAMTSSATPVRVAGDLKFTTLAAGGFTVCALTTAGKAYCWGDSFYGTVGDGTTAVEGGPIKHLSPTAVAGGLTFQSLSAGYQTMCGVAASGSAYCWGYNFGAIGDGTSDHRSTPSAVAGGLSFASVASGSGFTCALTTTSGVFCWGDNSGGQLGDGTLNTRTTPGEVLWP
jgi:alpha-tubulin suppressor-like RCC1 family protein